MAHSMFQYACALKQFNLHFFKHYLDEWNCRLSFMQPGVSIKMTQQNICPDEWQNARIPTVTQFQALQFNSTTKYRKTNRKCFVWMRVMSSWKHIRLSDIMVSFSLSTSVALFLESFGEYSFNCSQYNSTDTSKTSLRGFQKMMVQSTTTIATTTTTTQQIDQLENNKLTSITTAFLFLVASFLRCYS